MRYDERTIESIKEANDVVDVIGSYVRLTKKGGTYFGLCPFHGEKTPSFSVNQRRQSFHCFGCGEGGDVISFLMKYENQSFAEAVRTLADRAHISLPEPEYSAEEKKQNDLRKRLYEINKQAAYFYVKKLYTKDGEEGYRYFTEKRGLGPEDLKHFGLGYAPGGFDTLYRELKGRGYTDSELKSSGLFTYSGAKVRDKFYNRVMFPIMDVSNKVRGFGGRVLGDGEPKYLNSPETPVFSKSELLYGLNYAKKSREKYMLLCEGYMDVIALQRAGFTNAVASLGTALNEKHARLLKRYTDSVVLAQDSDAAGVKAKLKAYPILKEAGLNVRVLEITGAKDPDEFIKKYGAPKYGECIKNARNAFLYMVDVKKQEYDLKDPAGKTDFYNEVAGSLLMFREPVERDNYIDAVSSEFMIDRGMLKEMVEKKAALKEWDRADPSGGRAIYKAAPEENPPRGGYLPGRVPDGRHGRTKPVPGHEKLLISWLMERPELISALSGVVEPEHFETAVYRDAFREAAAGGRPDSSGLMLKYMDDEEARQLIAAAVAETDKRSVETYTRAELEKGLTEAVRALKTAWLDRRIAEGTAANDLALVGRLLREKNSLGRLRITVAES